MACCGSKTKQKPAKQKASFTGLPGADGLVKLEYLGKEAFIQRSARTGVYYEFGPDHQLGYVDKDDAAMLLELSENGNRLFKKLSALEIPLPLPEISSVVRGIGAGIVRRRAQET